jgi:hypothetical protein
MSNFIPPPLSSIEAVRPVFLIVMGVFMLLIAWRLAKSAGLWTARVMVFGALMLAIGYAVILPLYEAGVVERYAPEKRHYHGSEAVALGWHAVKIVVMNIGWLAFGTGLAMHARIFGEPAPRAAARQAVQTRTLAPHESAA